MRYKSHKTNILILNRHLVNILISLIKNNDRFGENQRKSINKFVDNAINNSMKSSNK